MNKKINLTGGVMSKIVRLENRRVKLWVGVFLVILAGLLLVAMVMGFLVWRAISERGTLDLLSLFLEDREIIGEFWQDTLTTFFEELPQRRILMTALAVGLAAGLILITRKSREVLRRKWEELRKLRGTPK